MMKKDRVVGLAKRDPVLLLTHIDGSISALYKGKHYSLAEFHSSPVIQASTPAVTIESKPMENTVDSLQITIPGQRPSYEYQPTNSNRHVMQLKIRITKMLASRWAAT